MFVLLKKIIRKLGKGEDEKMRTLKDLDLKGKRVLVRVDFDVPIKNGEVVDDEKIKLVLPTINYLLEQNSQIILLSHLGRAEGKVVSLEPVAKRLAEIIRRTLEIKKVPRVGKKFFFLKEELEPKISLLENLYFWPEEIANSSEFAKSLAGLGDIFVQEAFACCHYDYASITGIPKYLPSCAGFLLQKEIEFLSKLITDPERPFIAILGGAKVSDKLEVLENLLNKVDSLLIGGATAYTFLKAKGFLIGSSKIEETEIENTSHFLEKAIKKGVRVFLPCDHIVVKERKENVIPLFNPEVNISSGFEGVDIGYQTRREFVKVLKGAKTVFWNGPLGVCERGFSKGTLTIAYFLKNLTEKGVITIATGGDTGAVLKKAYLTNKITYFSLGEATLEFLKGKILPGIAALK